MSEKTVTCETCGCRLRIGDWPFCRGDPKDHEPSVNKQPPFQPYWDEHIAEKSVFITSAHQRFKLMEKGDLDMKRHPETKRITHRKMFFMGNR